MLGTQGHLRQWKPQPGWTHHCLGPTAHLAQRFVSPETTPEPMATLSPWLGCQLQSTLLLPKACPKILDTELTSAHHALKSAFCRVPSSLVQTKPGFPTHPSPGEAGGRLLSHLANSSIFPAALSTRGASPGSCEHSLQLLLASGAHLLQQDGLAAFQPWILSIPWWGELPAAEEPT